MEKDDDERQYQCARKFDKMVKQFEGLMEMVDARTNLLKRSRVISSPRKGRPISATGRSNSTANRGSKSNRVARGSGTSTRAAPSQTNDIQSLVHAITNHINDLNNDHQSDSDCATSTDN